ncbi:MULTISPECIES: P-type conjugative transfer protein TrbG [Sphingomonadaceae]|jgi:type IV secretion system protein VirB9|uniref:Type IV secretion system protein VirB9 n=11 Tax=Pseudomonadota TaxID=1224 RepID=A0A7W6BPA7_9SPHN|nr:MULTISPECIES: P-type conjugative transfer protein TrbG [Sphingomonadaceae]ARR57763.1 P-type conjugative transfer protein TrbG [Rhizorhabdus wittichii DC-6]MBK6721251.1 P-type conjugative transfer protein TrbG [Sphingomonadales bacterium]MBP6363925.1 P-type conjugative transfer protein TrbG [Novosphingobium sp.]MCZ4343854.1 P-type conjugative transfer protein TrbG [Sphingomonadaceae bacterium G21617-S1]AJR26589.1 conjugal transfer protein TrbG [Sphingobium sp. YBL2]
MKKIAYFAAALAALPSIASAQDGPPLPDDMPPANAPMPAGGGAQVDPNAYISPRNPNLTRTQREGLSIARRWQAESAEGIKPVPGTEGAVLFAFGTSEPSVVCAVLQICDVQLQPGENINSVNVGDSARWLIEPAVSNSGPNETQHLIIKPLDANLNTTLIVTTDRRTYHIRLVSHRTQFMSRVAFTYPDEAQAKWAAFRARSDTARAENTMAVPDGARGTGRGGSEYLSNLDFHYSVDGRARWKPVRVYNDGVKTIIEMPHAMEQTEAPSLLIVRAGGSVSKAADTSIVNYRLQDGRYIVDQIFDQAVLISGVGKRQERVTITRGG